MLCFSCALNEARGARNPAGRSQQLQPLKPRATVASQGQPTGLGVRDGSLGRASADVLPACLPISPLQDAWNAAHERHCTQVAGRKRAAGPVLGRRATKQGVPHSTQGALLCLHTAPVCLRTTAALAKRGRRRGRSGAAEWLRACGPGGAWRTERVRPPRRLACRASNCAKGIFDWDAAYACALQSGVGLLGFAGRCSRKFRVTGAEGWRHPAACGGPFCAARGAIDVKYCIWFESEGWHRVCGARASILS